MIEYVKSLHGIALNPLYKMVTSELIFQAHNHHIQLYPWTINEPEMMVEYANMGVDGIITDFPNMAVEILDALISHSD